MQSENALTHKQVHRQDRLWNQSYLRYHYSSVKSNSSSLQSVECKDLPISFKCGYIFLRCLYVKKKKTFKLTFKLIPSSNDTHIQTRPFSLKSTFFDFHFILKSRKNKQTLKVNVLAKEIQILCIIKTALAQTAHLRVCKKKKKAVGGCAVNSPINKNHLLFYLGLLQSVISSGT